jgi:imidazolonepropionase
MKVTGVPYEEIARSGGGIASSARALAGAADADVLAQAGAVRAEMLRLGTTTIEGKTGYGLSVDGELRSVRLGRALGLDRVTGLFAHAVPAGHTPGSWMEEVDGLAAQAEVDALDIYVESVAFRNQDLERLGAIARREGVPLRAHVEQFATHRSVPVALAAGARSVDHLACLHPDDLEPLARAQCAAVLLPARSSSAPSARRRRGRWPTPARSACWPPTAIRGRRRSRRCRWRSVWRCAATAGACARRWRLAP